MRKPACILIVGVCLAGCATQTSVKMPPLPGVPVVTAFTQSADTAFQPQTFIEDAGEVVPTAPQVFTYHVSATACMDTRGYGFGFDGSTDLVHWTPVYRGPYPNGARVCFTSVSTNAQMFFRAVVNPST